MSPKNTTPPAVGVTPLWTDNCLARQRHWPVSASTAFSHPPMENRVALAQVLKGLIEASPPRRAVAVFVSWLLSASHRRAPFDLADHDEIIGGIVGRPVPFGAAVVPDRNARTRQPRRGVGVFDLGHRLR